MKEALLRSRELGFVFQKTHLVSKLTLYENVAVAGYVGKKRPPRETAERASEDPFMGSSMIGMKGFLICLRIWQPARSKEPI